MNTSTEQGVGQHGGHGGGHGGFPHGGAGHRGFVIRDFGRGWGWDGFDWYGWNGVGWVLACPVGYGLNAQGQCVPIQSGGAGTFVPARLAGTPQGVGHEGAGGGGACCGSCASGGPCEGCSGSCTSCGAMPCVCGLQQFRGPCGGGGCGPAAFQSLAQQQPAGGVTVNTSPPPAATTPWGTIAIVATLSLAAGVGLAYVVTKYEHPRHALGL